MLHAKFRKQKELPLNITNLNDRKYEFLKNSVYHIFRTVILPILPVKIFKKHFNTSIGRKTKDIQSIIGLFIFQAMFDYTDQQSVEAYTFDQKFHYALDLKEDDAYLSIRSFYYYKSIILGTEKRIFDRVLDKIKETIELDYSIQRTDSTQVGLNLKKMSQWELFKSTLIKFLKELKSCFPQEYQSRPEHIQSYLREDKEAWFTGFSPSKAQDYLVQAAQDALSLKDMFKDHPQISEQQAFELLARLIAEQVTVSDEGIKVELKPECKGSALANPHDPEAQYNGRKKEAGVKATISETCSPDEETDNPQIITNVDVQPANVSDIDILQPSIEEREERDLKPDLELTDNGFESDANHQALQEKDVDLIAPPTGEAPDGFGIIDFELGDDGQTILSCPLGVKCQSNKVNKKAKKTTSYFDPAVCRDCVHQDDCPIKITKRKARVIWSWNKPRLEARRIAFQYDEELIELYRKRSGGEAVVSQLKNHLGLKRLRTRGLDKAGCRIVFAAIALNIKRLTNWLAKTQGTSTSKRRHSRGILSARRFFWARTCLCQPIDMGMAA